MARSSIFQFSSLLPHYAPGSKKIPKAAVMTKNEDASVIFLASYLKLTFDLQQTSYSWSSSTPGQCLAQIRPHLKVFNAR